MKKELTVSAPVTAALTTYTGALISEQSFQELSDIIEKISTNKEELTDGMRQGANQYADTWDNLVVERLNNRIRNLDNLQDFFNCRRPTYLTISSYCQHINRYKSAPAEIPAVTNMLRSGDNKTWHKFADRLEDISLQVEKLEEDASNEIPVREDYFFDDERNMGYDDKIIAQKKFELDMAQHEKKFAKAQLKVRKAFVSVLSDMLQDADIKVMLACLKEQRKKAYSAQSLVHEKSALVKLAINFGGTKLLSALQELHEFQQKL